MSKQALSRRQFLVYTGAGAAGFATASALGPLAQAAEVLPAGSTHGLAHAIVAAQRAGLRPGPYPLPLPLDGIDPSAEAAAFANFTIQDDLVLGRGLEYYV